jgi:V8-like Glu-specific endopeptidase
MGNMMIKTFILMLFLIQSALADVSLNDQGVSAIYGKDDRVFVDKNSSPKIRELSKSIVLIVSRNSVEKNILFSRIHANNLDNPRGLNICQDEKFAAHHSVDSCTGFLVAEDMIATAGHCISNQAECDGKLFAFNVQLSNENNNGHKVLNKNVYECSEVVTNVFDSEGAQDFAIIRLKKKVFGRKALKLRTNGFISSKDQVFMIGHPLGLPLVATNNAFVKETNLSHSFKATLDSFEGNSGSPVFNSKTFEVEGILVRGEEDFVHNESRQCYQYQVYDQGSKKSPTRRGEGVSRISDILPFLSF